MLEISGGNQRKHFFVVVVAFVGRKISAFYPDAENFCVFYDRMLCSKMPQEYKDDSFSPKEF